MADGVPLSFWIELPLGVCRFCLFVVVLIVGCIVSAKLSGAQYFALVEEAETIGPYCRAIVYDYMEDGTQIGWDYKLGGQGIDLGAEAKVGIAFVNVQKEAGHAPGSGYEFGNTETSFKYSESGWDPTLKYFEAPQCQMQVTKVKELPEKEFGWAKRKVMLHNLETRAQVKMPEFCGGDQPGEWLDMLNDKVHESGGMWASPLIVGLVCWFILRTLALVGSWYVAYTGEFVGVPVDNPASKIVLGFFKFLFCISCNFFLAPIQNMEFHEICPQVILSYYSGKLQMGFLYGTIIVMAVFCCCTLLGACWQSYAEQNLPPNDLVATHHQFCMGAGLGCAGGVTVVLTLIGGIWYHIHKAWWGIFFGVEINLSWYFPEFTLAMQVNVFHLMMLILVILDWMDGVVTCATSRQTKGDN